MLQKRQEGSQMVMMDLDSSESSWDCFEPFEEIQKYLGEVLLKVFYGSKAVNIGCLGIKLFGIFQFVFENVYDVNFML